MKRRRKGAAIVAGATLVALACGWIGWQFYRARASEVWAPVPPVVAPGPETPAPPPSNAIVLFDGSNMDAWSTPHAAAAPWATAEGAFTIVPGSGDIQTRRTFTDYQLHLEWRTPAAVQGSGQARGNSGLFLGAMGDHYGYELQILDSYQNSTYVNGQAGAIYKQDAPLANPMRPPGSWQSYDVTWTAPRFNASGSLASPAYLTAHLNGVLVQDHVALHGGTVFTGVQAYRAHGALPIRLQDHRSPVSFRNIWLVER